MALIDLVAAICLQLPDAAVNPPVQDLQSPFAPTKLVTLILDTSAILTLNTPKTVAMAPMPDSPSTEPRLLEPWDTSKAPPVKLLEPWNVGESPPVMLIAD
ncbi:MAG: hypothetical protein ACTHMT_13220 [Verrucomicrobiota bacterium]|jgi:hypothetical protein